MGALAMMGPAAKAPALQKIPGLSTAELVAGRYRIEKVLGAGGSGFVVAARHVYLRRPVTLKIMSLTTNARQQMQREHLAVAHRAAGLRSPHIARIIDTGITEDGAPFIATERLEGRTVADELAERGTIATQQAVRWILQACAGLAEAHGSGIVHADLKPQNLFVVGDSSPAEGGDLRIVKILDFGMTTPMDDGQDHSSAAWFASPAYLSPEQISDPAGIDRRTDIWALGVLLHELISGSLPFSSETVSGMLVAVTCDKPAMLVGPDVPFELARIVHACLSKERSERPADVTELAMALAPFAGADGVPLASRVEAALSAPPSIPPRAAEPVDADVAPLAHSLPPTTEERRPRISSRRRDDDVDVDDLARRRRRNAAMGAIGAAAVLAIVGLLAPEPNAEMATKVATATHELRSAVIEKVEGASLAAPADTVPVIAAAALPAAPLVAPPPVVAAPKPAPMPLVAGPKQAAPARRAETNLPVHGSSRPAPPHSKPKLLVRDDPYGKPAISPQKPIAAPRVGTNDRHKKQKDWGL